LRSDAIDARPKSGDCNAANDAAPGSGRGS
jgi:hypothetical protein